MKWALSILAVLMLYLLSVPIIVIRFQSDPFDPRFNLYRRPSDWLCDNTPLEDPYEIYWQWCRDHVAKKR